MSESTRDEYIRKYGYEAVARANGELPQTLTKREWFAGMAMQGMIARHHVQGSPKEFAEQSFRLADAMLAESEKP